MIYILVLLPIFFENYCLVLNFVLNANFARKETSWGDRGWTADYHFEGHQGERCMARVRVNAVKSHHG